MAIKFHLPNGEEVDMVTNSLKFFPVSNGADFRDLFLAVAASPPDAPKPTKFERFAAALALPKDFARFRRRPPCRFARTPLAVIVRLPPRRLPATLR
jgi:hypothetical protein